VVQRGGRNGTRKETSIGKKVKCSHAEEGSAKGAIEKTREPWRCAVKKRPAPALHKDAPANGYCQGLGESLEKDGEKKEGDTIKLNNKPKKEAPRKKGNTRDSAGDRRQRGIQLRGNR